MRASGVDVTAALQHASIYYHDYAVADTDEAADAGTQS